MSHKVKTISVQDLRYRFKRIEGILRRGEALIVTKRGRPIARLLPESTRPMPEMPDFEARLMRFTAARS